MKIIKSRAAIALLGLLVMAPLTLRGDETRIFKNASKVDLVFIANFFANDETANMWFTSNGKAVGSLGETNKRENVAFPAGSNFNVEFTHTNRNFYHEFKIRDKDSTFVTNCITRYDWPSFKLNQKAVFIKEDGSSGMANSKIQILLNSPKDGDILVIDSPKGAAAGDKKQAPATTATAKKPTAEEYRALGLDPTTNYTFSEVRKAYHKLALAEHPDKNPAPGSEAKFKVIVAAYEHFEDYHQVSDRK